MKISIKRVLLLPVFAGFCLGCLSGCGLLDKKVTVLREEPRQEEPVAPAQLEEYWYGYWYLSDASGEWEELEGYSWDCCAQLSDDSQQYSLILWDEDMPKDYYLALMDIQQTDDGYCCTGGEFLDMDLGRALVNIKLKEDEGQLLDISGRYSDGSTGSFYYVVILRPWGELWPEGRNRPYFYERWYLPKIEAGELPPDEIEPGR